MNGPLIAVLMVLAAFAWLGWFTWMGMANPPSVQSWSVLWVLCVGFAAALAWAWGCDAAGIVSVCVAVGVIVAGGILKVELRSRI